MLMKNLENLILAMLPHGTCSVQLLKVECLIKFWNFSINQVPTFKDAIETLMKTVFYIYAIITLYDPTHTYLMIAIE